MTWEEIDHLKHELQAMEIEFVNLQRKFGQLKFTVESAILKKKD